MRRFTRLTNAFSKKVDNHGHMVALCAIPRDGRKPLVPRINDANRAMVREIAAFVQCDPALQHGQREGYADDVASHQTGHRTSFGNLVPQSLFLGLAFALSLKFELPLWSFRARVNPYPNQRFHFLILEGSIFAPLCIESTRR